MIRLVEIMATITTIASIACVTNEIMVLGFIIGLVGNVTWLAWGFVLKNYGIIVVNLVMGMLYLSGLFN